MSVRHAFTIYLMFLILVFLSACSLSEGFEYGERCQGMERIVFETGICTKGECLGCDVEASKRCDRYQFIFALDNKSCPKDYSACTGVSCRLDSCASGQVLCDEQCVSPQTDVNYCGAGSDCSKNPGAVCDESLKNAYKISCEAGACKYGACLPGYGDCDGDASNACETELATVLNCGQCGVACSVPENTEAAFCKDGVCSYTSCLDGFGDCDGDVSNGCERALSEVSHCGACANDCSKLDKVSEVDCVAGACKIISCAEGFGDCDGVVSNGCETDLSTSLNHCGVCEQHCPSGEVCSAGVCALTCVSGQVICDGRCVDPDVDSAFCGTTDCSDGVKCSDSVANAYGVSCVGGVCGYEICKDGYADCDGVASNGCEADLTSNSSCGSCLSFCITLYPSKPNMEVRCVDGTCSLVCVPGYGDCDGDVSNGCEADLRASNSHCGACRSPCIKGSSCHRGKCLFEYIPPFDPIPVEPLP